MTKFIDFPTKKSYTGSAIRTLLSGPGVSALIGAPVNIIIATCRAGNSGNTRIVSTVSPLERTCTACHMKGSAYCGTGMVR